MAGDDHPGPTVGSRGIMELRGAPAQGLFEQVEGVLQVEPADEGLPTLVDLGRGEPRGRGPQPDWFGISIAGQGAQPPAGSRHLRAPSGPAGPSDGFAGDAYDPMSRLEHSHTAGSGCGRGVWLVPAGRIGEAEMAAMFRWTAVRTGQARWCGPVKDSNPNAVARAAPPGGQPGVKQVGLDRSRRRRSPACPDPRVVVYLWSATG